MPWLEEELIKPHSQIIYSGKVREANRQYEFNYNEQVDNGIIITNESGRQSERYHDLIRQEIQELDIFKNHKGQEKHVMVSPNISNKSESDS